MSVRDNNLPAHANVGNYAYPDQTGGEVRNTTPESVVQYNDQLDHGLLQGLGDDDHPQYKDYADGLVAGLTISDLTDVPAYDPAGSDDGKVLTPLGGTLGWYNLTAQNALKLNGEPAEYYLALGNATGSLDYNQIGIGGGHTEGQVLRVPAGGIGLEVGSIVWDDIASGVPAFASRWPTWTEVSSKPSVFPPDLTGVTLADLDVPAYADGSQDGKILSPLGGILGWYDLTAKNADQLGGQDPAYYLALGNATGSLSYSQIGIGGGHTEGQVLRVPAGGIGLEVGSIVTADISDWASALSGYAQLSGADFTGGITVKGNISWNDAGSGARYVHFQGAGNNTRWFWVKYGSSYAGTPDDLRLYWYDGTSYRQFFDFSTSSLTLTIRQSLVVGASAIFNGQVRLNGGLTGVALEDLDVPTYSDGSVDGKILSPLGGILGWYDLTATNADQLGGQDPSYYLDLGNASGSLSYSKIGIGGGHTEGQVLRVAAGGLGLEVGNIAAGDLPDSYLPLSGGTLVGGLVMNAGYIRFTDAGSGTRDIEFTATGGAKWQILKRGSSYSGTPDDMLWTWYDGSNWHTMLNALTASATLAVGAWWDFVLQGGDLRITSGAKLRLDGNASGNTHIQEVSADQLELTSGGSRVRMTTARLYSPDGIELGASNVRWSTIYGVTADFSGALTANGNITAGGNKPLLVNGDSTVLMRLWSKLDTADSRAWDIRGENGSLTVRAITDTGATQVHALTVSRSGNFTLAGDATLGGDLTLSSGNLYLGGGDIANVGGITDPSGNPYAIIFVSSTEPSSAPDGALWFQP